MKFLQDIVDNRTKLSQSEISELLHLFREANNEKTNVVRIPANHVYFIGDLHGDIGAFNTVKDQFIHSNNSIVFLGDYVDRGSAQIETVNSVFALSLLYPKRVTVLRGNHESESVSTKYGFFMSVSREYSDSLYREYCEAFKTLPLAGISKNGIFCCHGGIPENLESLDQLQQIERRDVNLVNPIVYQLLWNDPREKNFHFRPNFRGGWSKEYGTLAFNEFSERMGVSLMLRAHEAYTAGFKKFFDGRLVSVFSTSYGGRLTPHIAELTTNLEVKPIPI